MSRVDDVDYVKMIERARAKYLRLKEKKSLYSTFGHTNDMVSTTIEEMHKLHLIKLELERQRAQQDNSSRCTCSDCIHTTTIQCKTAECKCCLTAPFQAETPYRRGVEIG